VLITYPEEYYRLCEYVYLIACDLEISIWTVFSVVYSVLTITKLLPPLAALALCTALVIVTSFSDHLLAVTANSTNAPVTEFHELMPRSSSSAQAYNYADIGTE
jgi:hypothetical protein